jgi:branched-chain amino acid transport system substrate-binding protein
VRDQAAEVLLSDTFFADHLLLVRQMAQSGLRVDAFLGAFGLEFPSVVLSSARRARGCGTTSWQSDVNWAGREQESRLFVAAYTRRFDRAPVPLTMHGYAAARAVTRALETLEGGAITGDRLREALAKVDLETPLGRVKFDDHGDPVAYERVVVQIQNGRHVVVYPPNHAAARPKYPAR